jgi:glycosyltransferase involved in cell wall biosynthesis
MVEEAVRSVLGQSHPVDQIVVVDDGSEETQARELLRLADVSPSIEVVRHATPRGPAAARNSGLARVRGDYLLFLDDDDLIHPRLVEDGLTVLAEQPAADVVVFRYCCFAVDERRCGSNSLGRIANAANFPAHALQLADRDNPVPRDVLEHRPVSAFLRYLIPIQSAFLRRSSVGPVRFPEELRQGEDTYFWIALAASGGRFIFDERVYAYVRRHAGNVTRSRWRYLQEIQPCYERLLADGLLCVPEDAYLAHLKLLWFKGLTGREGRRRHLIHALHSPGLLARELAFWTANLLSRTGTTAARRVS